MKKLILLALVWIDRKIRKLLKADKAGNSYNWGKGAFMLALAAVMMAGCEEYVETKYYTGEGLRICVIDSCEYIHYSCGWGPEYTHKGNCRFCKERRQKELDELVIRIKWK